MDSGAVVRHRRITGRARPDGDSLAAALRAESPDLRIIRASARSLSPLAGLAASSTPLSLGKLRHKLEEGLVLELRATVA